MSNRTINEMQIQIAGLHKCSVSAHTSRGQLARLQLQHLEYLNRRTTLEALLNQFKATATEYEILRTHCEAYLNLPNIPENGKDTVMASLRLANNILQKLAEKRRELLAQAN